MCVDRNATQREITSMDWVTAVGLVMSALATADLAYKYGSAILKKITAGHVSEQRTKYTQRPLQKK